MTVYMIDTHCHLVDNKFKSDIDEVVERAKASSVKHAVVCPEYASQFEAVLILKDRHPDFVLPAIGVHPIQKKNKSVREEDIAGVEAFLLKHRDQIYCIGEVGLDFTQYYKISAEQIVVQKEVLAKHVEWAKQLELPLTVHSRSACGETVDFLIESSATRVALHAFNGSLEEALRGLDAGFFFSIPPSFTTGDHVRHIYPGFGGLIYDVRFESSDNSQLRATFPFPSADEWCILINNEINKKRFLIEAVPLERLLLETDSPVLGPVRGERNEPANLRLSAEFIAEVKKVPVEEVMSKTTENAEILLGLQKK